MRVAFAGKGGSGKSTVAGTVARLLGRGGERVLALDVDTLPGLSFSLGLGRTGDEGLPEELAERREGEGWVMRAAVSAEELVDRHSLEGPDGVRFLQLGKLPSHVRPGSTTAFRHVVEGFRRPGWSIVGDLSGGLRQASFGWAGFASLVAIVIEPTSAGMMTARRLRALCAAIEGAALGLVLNKARGETRRPQLEAAVELPVWSEIPYDPVLAQAEQAGHAAIDVAEESPAVRAITTLVESLRAVAARQEERS